MSYHVPSALPSLVLPNNGDCGEKEKSPLNPTSTSSVSSQLSIEGELSKLHLTAAKTVASRAITNSKPGSYVLKTAEALINLTTHKEKPPYCHPIDLEHLLCGKDTSIVQIAVQVLGMGPHCQPPLPPLKAVACPPHSDPSMGSKTTPQLLSEEACMGGLIGKGQITCHYPSSKKAGKLNSNFYIGEVGLKWECP
ncbi:hypothetical protein P7K49_008517 [Saguinus oedipus]|uniref:Uncharacterized protein n=1 Tax=Saguinus oedipus TaxID=9490 RepID=A0ABQ9VXZ4_SAGOE|nr:hypothetical protein P7K49_008517 [Saguinus oedipus]